MFVITDNIMKRPVFRDIDIPENSLPHTTAVTDCLSERFEAIMTFELRQLFE
jgi:hypothetical protein